MITHTRCRSTPLEGARRIDWHDIYEHELRPRLTLEFVFGPLTDARLSGRKLRARCPLHGGRNRNFAVDRATLAWFCHSKCNIGGGPLEFIFRRRGGTGELRGSAFVQLVRQLCDDLGVRVAEEDVRDVHEGEAEQVWHESLPVTADRVVTHWLARERKLDPELVATYDLARVIPPAVALPRWAGYQRGSGWCSWPSSGYRIIVALVDGRGRVRSLRFRKPATNGKGRSACGVSGIGLVMADAIACSVLASGRVPGFWTANEFAVVIAEGEPDFWSWATEPARSGIGHGATSFPPALGIVSGSFDASIALRLPHRTHVLSALDHDEAGDRMHARLVRVLQEAGRGFSVSRWRPHE